MNVIKIVFAFVSHGSIDALSTSLLSLSKQLVSVPDKTAEISILVVENSCPLMMILLLSLCQYLATTFLPLRHKLLTIKVILMAHVAIEYSFAKGFDCLVVGNPDVSFGIQYIRSLCEYLDCHDFLVGVPSVSDHFGLCQNPRYITRYPQKKLFVQQIMFSCFPAYVFFQSLINVKRSISLVLPRNTPSNRCMESADLSSMVLPAGVQFVFNISKIQSPFKFPELVFLWGEEVIISNFCLTYLDPILLLKAIHFSF